MKPTIKSAIAEELLETGKLTSFQAIDVHGHMGPFAQTMLPTHTPELMVKTLDRCGIQCLIFAHHEALEDPLDGNRLSQEAVDAHPGRLLGYCTVNANYPEVIAKHVETYNQFRGFAGYKILPSYYGTPITHPAYRPIWAHAHEDKRPVLVHTWGQDPNTTPDQIGRIAGDFPQARILMAHSLHANWDGAIELARTFEHVYCELCAAHFTNGLIQKFVEAGIEDKVLYGSDLPWFDPMDIIGAVVFSHINDTARKKILRDNASRIFQRWL